MASPFSAQRWVLAAEMVEVGPSLHSHGALSGDPTSRKMSIWSRSTSPVKGTELVINLLHQYCCMWGGVICLVALEAQVGTPLAAINAASAVRPYGAVPVPATAADPATWLSK